MTNSEDVPGLFMDCCSISSDALKLKSWVFPVVVLLLLPVAVGQNGFISIDCGSTSNYTDGTGIQWSTDDSYVVTGTNMAVTVPEHLVDEGRQISTARYFPSGSKRFCYRFPNVTNNASYLIRASFLCGDLVTPLPISFDLAIDSSIVKRIDIQEDEVYNMVTVEYFVAARSEEISFCLLPSKENPFISSLELRPLESQMYSGYVFRSQYGVLTQRLNSGANLTDPAIRYPDDRFDRIWETPNSSYSEIPTVSTIEKLNTGESDFDLPPLAVMQSAWQDTSFWFAIESAINRNYYIGLYVAEFRNPNAEKQTELRILLNGEVLFSDELIPSDKITTQIGFQHFSTSSVLNFTIRTWNINTDLPALLNAYEIHMIYEANTSTIASFDRQVLDDLRQSLNLMDWTGDPCFPVPWDWLSCTGDDTATVTQIKLSNYQLQGTIPSSIGTLTTLTDLWLDNNNITGSIPNLVRLSKLRTLHLQNNSLTGAIPATLASISSLTELFLRDNDFNGTVPAALLNRSRTGLNLTVDGLDSPGAPPQSPAPSPDGGTGPISTAALIAIIVVPVEIPAIASVIVVLVIVVNRRLNPITPLPIDDDRPEYTRTVPSPNRTNRWWNRFC